MIGGVGSVNVSIVHVYGVPAIPSLPFNCTERNGGFWTCPSTLIFASCVGSDPLHFLPVLVYGPGLQLDPLQPNLYLFFLG